MYQELSPQRFAGAKMKLFRSKQLFDQFATQVASFMNQRPYRLEVVEDEVTGDTSFVIRGDATLPAEWSVIIGEIIHNLRAALDLLAVDLARENGNISRSAINETYFPVASDKANFDTSGIRKIRRLSASAQKIIADLLPYKGGNDDLWKLHQLDILDKHVLLVPVVAASFLESFQIGLPAPPDGEDANVSVNVEVPGGEGPVYPITDGTVLLKVSKPTNPDGVFHLDAKFSVVFDRNEISDGEGIVETLNRLGQTVDNVIGSNF